LKQPSKEFKAASRQGFRQAANVAQAGFSRPRRLWKLAERMRCARRGQETGYEASPTTFCGGGTASTLPATGASQPPSSFPLALQIGHVLQNP